MSIAYRFAYGLHREAHVIGRMGAGSGMTKRLQDELAYPPRAMRVDRAAAYLSMSRSAFLVLVDAGTLPKPTRIGGMVLWDRLALDVAFEELATVEGEGDDRPNSFDAVIEAIRK